MNQGPPSRAVTLSSRDRKLFTSALTLAREDVRPLPFQVVSTGLP